MSNIDSLSSWFKPTEFKNADFASRSPKQLSILLDHMELRAICHMDKLYSTGDVFNLVDDDNAGGFGCLQVLELDLLAFEEDLPVVGSMRIHARKHLHQRGLARAVLATDRMNLTAVDGKVHVIKSPYSWKLFGDVSHLQNGVRHRNSIIHIGVAAVCPLLLASRIGPLRIDVKSRSQYLLIRY